MQENESDHSECVAARCIEDIRKSGHSGPQLGSELEIARGISAAAIQGVFIYSLHRYNDTKHVINIPAGGSDTVSILNTSGLSHRD